MRHPDPPPGFAFTDPAYAKAGYVHTPHWHAWESNYGALTDRAYPDETGPMIVAGRWAAKYRRDKELRVKRREDEWAVYDAESGEELFTVGLLMCEADDDCHMIERVSPSEGRDE